MVTAMAKKFMRLSASVPDHFVISPSLAFTDMYLPVRTKKVKRAKAKPIFPIIVATPFSFTCNGVSSSSVSLKKKWGLHLQWTVLELQRLPIVTDCSDQNHQENAKKYPHPIINPSWPPLSGDSNGYRDYSTNHEDDERERRFQEKEITFVPNLSILHATPSVLSRGNGQWKQALPGQCGNPPASPLL
ncbi:unnamed protein product [Cuscuta campestris]|uniref:Uncharacterized protein n=1 Tax=Cuscuta campestris TaxID=132261 RepID=A0A484NMI6_9ASTE|nr:unnamed protein product [Cuscuta campestris]